MVVIHTTGLDMSGTFGYVFLILCIVVLFLEFFKSGDIKVSTFLIDLVTSVVALVIATVLMSYLVFKHGEAPTFFDWFGVAIILGDSIISPFNSFRTALRNMEIGGGGGF
jgi:hypothetical protein